MREPFLFLFPKAKKPVPEKEHLKGKANLFKEELL